MLHHPLATHLTTRADHLESGYEVLWHASGSRVAFTAPHNQPVLRDGKHKQRDKNVGLVAVHAAMLSQANALVATSAGDIDANRHPESMFRSTLLKLLDPASIVVDVHGMTDLHSVDAVVGTAGARSPGWLVEAVVSSVVEAGFTCEVRHEGPLSASPSTLTWALLDYGHYAVQVEIAAKLRDVEHAPERLEAISAALAAGATRACSIGLR